MDRQGSRCPLPGYPRSPVLICFLILPVAFLTYSLFRTIGLQLHSAIAGPYISGAHSIVFVNCPNEQIARDIARAILEKKLAASVNILPRASSLYVWKGEIEETTEILLLIKTRTSKVPKLFSYIRLVHTFEIPEVFSLPMDQADVHYLKWLEEDFRRVVLCSVEMEVLSTEIEPLEPAGPVVFTFAVRNSRGRQKVRGAALVRCPRYEMGEDGKALIYEDFVPSPS